MLRVVFVVVNVGGGSGGGGGACASSCSVVIVDWWQWWLVAVVVVVVEMMVVAVVVADGTRGVAVVGGFPGVYAAVLFFRSVAWLGESMPIVRPLAPLLLLLAAAHFHRVCFGPTR